MLRNILAKPSIRYLVLTGTSLTDSEEAMLDFFKHGVDQDWKIITNGAQIDVDLPLPALNDVRKGVELIDLRGSQPFETRFHELTGSLEPRPAFAKPRTFPKTPHTVQTFPSEFSGFIVRQRTICEAWLEIIWTVMTFGHTSPTDYGLEQKEVLALLSVIEEPQSHLDYLPDWSPFTKEDITNYVHTFLDAESHDNVAYNYGYRLQSHWTEDQLESMATELKRSGHSRRAVASLWDPREDSGTSDPVCLTTIQAAVRDGKLHLMTYIRSNDMFRAYPLNAAALAALQQRLTERVGKIAIGSLEILSFSAHIYSDCWDLCERAKAEASRLNRGFQQDDRGSFVFRMDHKRLVADHYSPLGDLVQTFTSKNASELTELIAPFVSRVDHAMYLAREIGRLASAFENGQAYEQDEVRKGRKG
jgi:thymidylate synthase